MALSRRQLLSSAVPVMALAAAGCSTAQLTNLAQQWTNFVDQVNAILAAGCSTLLPPFIATATTIEAVVNVLYPGVGAAVSGIAGAVQAVATALCSTIPVAPPAQLSRKLAKSSARTPVVIGTVTVNGQPVTVTGYK